MDSILPELGGFSAFTIDAHGRAGGLSLMWDNLVTVHILSYSSHHIDAAIKWERYETEWQFSGIYGWPDTQHKWKMGQLLSDLRSHSTLPWLVGGDLNEIFFHQEKRGGPLKPQSIIDNFQEAFIDVGLFDLGYSGYDFTWSNFKTADATVEERLDRFCADTDWSLLFPGASVTHVDFDMSDHLPILLKCFPRDAVYSRKTS